MMNSSFSPTEELNTEPQVYGLSKFTILPITQMAKRAITWSIALIFGATVITISFIPILFVQSTIGIANGVPTPGDFTAGYSLVDQGSMPYGLENASLLGLISVVLSLLACIFVVLYLVRSRNHGSQQLLTTTMLGASLSACVSIGLLFALSPAANAGAQSVAESAAGDPTFVGSYPISAQAGPGIYISIVLLIVGGVLALIRFLQQP